MNYNADTKTGIISVVKSDFVNLCEPPFDMSLMADYLIDVCYKVVNETTFNMAKNAFPTDIIGESVAVDVFRAVKKVYPDGLSCADIYKPSDSVSRIAFESTDKNAFEYCSIVITDVLLKEIKISDNVFANSGMVGAMLKSKFAAAQQCGSWTCPSCSSVNNSKFCPNCGSSRN